MSLSELNELEKINLLAQVDDNTFESLCLTNKDYARICTHKFFKERLYEERTKAKFNDEVIELKENNISWYEFYNRLIKFLKEHKDITLANEYAKEGKLFELKILFKRNIFPNSFGAIWAAENGHVNVLKWMKENNLYSKFPTQYEANKAAGNGHVEVLKWMKENNLPIPDQNGANWAARRHRFEVLNWFASQNPPIVPN